MGLQRRKVNQLAEAESKAAEEIAASHQQKQQRPQAPTQQRSPLVSYLTTVALACLFWVSMQALYKYAAHLA